MKVYVNKVKPPVERQDDAQYRAAMDDQFLADLGLTSEDVELIDGGWNGSCWVSYFRTRPPRPRPSWWKLLLKDLGRLWRWT